MYPSLNELEKRSKTDKIEKICFQDYNKKEIRFPML